MAAVLEATSDAIKNAIVAPTWAATLATRATLDDATRDALMAAIRAALMAAPWVAVDDALATAPRADYDVA